MTGKLYNLYSLLLAAFFLQGCAVRSLYIPVTQNIPLFDSNKQIATAVYIGTNHVELQVTHNPVRKLAVATNINFGSGISIYDAAIGYYSHSKKCTWRYEVFAGYGYNRNIIFPATNLFGKQNVLYEVSSLYHKFYLQPAIGYFNRIYMYHINYSLSVSSRISLNHFKTFIYKETDLAQTNPNGIPVYLVNKQYMNKNLFLLEPCITHKVGYKNFYGIVQVQGFIPWSEEIDVRDTRFSQGFLLSLGLQYNFVFKHGR